MKKSLILFTFILCFLFIPKVDAYVRISSTGGYIDPTEKNIIDATTDWGMSGTYGSTSNSSPWLYSAGQFWYGGGLSGDYLTVNADYYVGIKTEPYSDAILENYLYSAQNTLTISNLRCGIGDFGQGYNSSYLPEITNFKVEGTNYYPDSGGTQYLLHITFNYKQRINNVVNTSSNMSCWFERSPSNGLFAQPVWYTNAQSIRYYYFNKNFQYAVSSDPNTAILNDINSALNNQTSQNNTIINNGYGIMNKQDEQIKQNEEAEETRKGIWETIKNLPSAFLDMLLGLFIPEDMDFLNDFVDVLEDKLGFIASIPIQLIEFITGLVTTSWETFDSISLPTISIFGYNFWNAQEIDLTEAINIFKPFKYVTDVICVVICARTLNRWRETFSGGGSGE